MSQKESGRISFFIKDEFNVALTLLGPPDERQWWIVSLDVLVKSTPGSEAEGKPYRVLNTYMGATSYSLRLLLF